MKKITRKNLENFLKHHATNEYILDIGAGKVNTNHSYTTFFPNRLTIDIDPKREPDVVGDVHQLPFEDASQSFILCTEVLEHCHTPQKAVDEMYRVLKPNGTLILTTRFVFPLHDVPHDYFRYTKYGLQYLFRNWEIQELVPETATFSALGALTQRIGFQTNLRGGKITKSMVYIFAFFMNHLNGLIANEYGNIQKTEEDDHILTTGYYIVCTK